MDDKEYYRIQSLMSLDFSNYDFETDGVAGNGVENFRNYFTAHYKPLLDKLADNPYQKINLTDKDKRLLSFLRDDLTNIFSI